MVDSGRGLAITDGGCLVYAIGFGYADKEVGIPLQPGSLFRFASISKTLTGMTIVKLAEEGRLNTRRHPPSVWQLVGGTV